MNDAIYNLKIFADLDKNIIDEIISNSKKEYYQTWEIILLQWDESNWKWYIISKWQVKVEVDKMQVALLGVWEIFGEIALLNDEERTATITAITDLEVIIVNIEDLISMISNWNETINKDIISRIEANLTNN